MDLTSSSSSTPDLQSLISVLRGPGAYQNPQFVTKDQLDTRRRLAEQLMNPLPVARPMQGVANMVRSALGGDELYRADQAAQGGMSAYLGALGHVAEAARQDTDPSQAGTAPAATPIGDHQDFIAKMTPHVLAAAEKTGVDPRIIIAQSAIETGWGQHAPGSNYFGIKGPGQNLPTTEMVNGQPVKTTASFRTYPDMASSVSGYADFINGNRRYGGLKAAQGLEPQLEALGRSGYASDSDYAAKVGAIARALPALGGGSAAIAAAAPGGGNGEMPPAASAYSGAQQPGNMLSVAPPGSPQPQRDRLANSSNPIVRALAVLALRNLADRTREIWRSCSVRRSEQRKAVQSRRR